jgi:uncharacterized protein
MMMGDLPPEQIDQLLRSQTLARLACLSQGEPYVLPLNYAYDGEAIYVHSLEGAKVRAMREHPRVCVEVDAIESPVSWRSAIVWGDYQELSGEAAQGALRRLVEHLVPQGAAPGRDPFTPPGCEDQVVIFRILLKEKHGRFACP